MLLIVRMWSTLVIVPVATPLLYEIRVIPIVVPVFWVLVPVLPSGPLHLWAALPKVELVTDPMKAVALVLWSVTVPAAAATVHVKVTPLVLSDRVKVVPVAATAVKLGPPVTVQVPAAMAAGTGALSAAAVTPAAKISPANRFRIGGPFRYGCLMTIGFVGLPTTVRPPLPLLRAS